MSVALEEEQVLVGAIGSLEASEDIAELENLKDRGLLTEDEFQRAREKALA